MKSVFLTITLAAFLGTGILLQQITAGETSDAKSVFEKKCSACHSLTRITSKKKTGEEWAKVVKKMKDKAENKDKARISDDEEKIIADYLAKEYGK